MIIKAVLFDADGVLIFQRWFSHYLEAEHGITLQMTTPFFHGPFDDCLEGRAELETALAPFLPEWGWKTTPADFVRTWLAYGDDPDERMLVAVQRLRQGGLICGLATTQERRRADYIRNRMGFEERFDRLFFSCDIGCQKPDRRYYEYIQNELGLSGEQILFWDDKTANVEAARQLGWQAEAFTDYEAFEQVMQNLLEG